MVCDRMLYAARTQHNTTTAVRHVICDRNNQGDTALHIAVRMKKLEVIGSYLDDQIKTMRLVQNNDRQTPAQVADKLEGGGQSIREYLERRWRW